MAEQNKLTRCHAGGNTFIFLPWRLCTSGSMVAHIVVDVFFRNGNYLFLKCCPGIINSCLNSCRLKTSTPQTPKRAERAR